MMNFPMNLEDLHQKKQFAGVEDQLRIYNKTTSVRDPIGDG